MSDRMLCSSGHCTIDITQHVVFVTIAILTLYSGSITGAGQVTLAVIQIVFNVSQGRAPGQQQQVVLHYYMHHYYY